MTQMRYDLPIPDDYTQAWWDATAEGRLLVAALRRPAARPTTTPGRSARAVGPRTWPGSRPAADAVLYTWSIVHSNDLPPFTGQGPLRGRGRRPGRRAADDDQRASGASPTTCAVGMALRVEFEELGDGFHIPVFRPA